MIQFYSNETDNHLGFLFTSWKRHLSALKFLEHCLCSRRPSRVFCDLLYLTLSRLPSTSPGPATVLPNAQQIMHSSGNFNFSYWETLCGLHSKFIWKDKHTLNFFNQWHKYHFQCLFLEHVARFLIPRGDCYTWHE